MIDILLSTYNGSKYLTQQIDSILNQDYNKWKLLIRDDDSTDATREILCDYESKYPLKIFVVDKNRHQNLGPTQSFGRLIEFVTDEYFMFADQDDIWHRDKIKVSLLEITHLESKYSKKFPLLVCSDASCIDANNNKICDSFYSSQKFEETVNNDIALLALNIVQGSTCLMNHSVIKYILPIPKYVQHDQWIAVITAHYGHITYIHKPLLSYRQHERNVLGALNISPKYFLKKFFNFKKQMMIYISFYENLPFKPNIFKWIKLKIYYTIKRLK